MASRRKSAKPTNKLRHNRPFDDDDDDEDGNDDPAVTGILTSKITTTHESSTLSGLSQILQQDRRTPSNTSALFDKTPISRHYLKLSQASTDPHIALPSDIYQDFEALKSATNLDTTELMRKLLTDYQKIASSSQSTRSREIDDVIDGIFASRSSNALDLSKRNGTQSFNFEQQNNTASITSYGYTDDQLAMGILDKVEGKVDSVDLKPLDLTLHKQQSFSSEDSSPTPMDISLSRQPIFSPPFKSFVTSNEEAQCSQSFKHAGSYVINLEPGNESTSFVNSSLAQVLRMDIPLHSFSKSNTYDTETEGTLFLKDGKITPPCSKKTNSEGSFQLCHGNVHSRSKLFQDDTEPMTAYKVTNHETSSSASSLSCLPSYAEAVTSVLNSQQSKQPFGSLVTATSADVQSITKAAQDGQSGTVSFVHISPEDADIKFNLLNVNSQLATSSEGQPKQQYHLLQQLLQHQLKSENKSLQRQLETVSTSQTHSNPLSTFCSGPISHIQMMQVPGIKTDPNDVQVMPQSLKNNDLYPNFLLESHTVGIPSISNALPSVTMASSTLPNTSVPLSTFFMTTSSNGGVGHMVAIPVIHALSDGVTGLQPFAFAPHHMNLQSNASTMLTHGSADMILTSSSTMSKDILSSSKQSEDSQNHHLLNSASMTPDIKQTSPLEAAKPKPGRPRGRGGRGQSQKTQNKDMKLLTENTLFPGVYTSILKLPWSRRSRNKTKVKTSSELKKQAQIIAHCRVNEEEGNFMIDSDHKQEYIEQEKNNNLVCATEQTHSQSTTEQLVENHDYQQEQTDHNQRQQIQQQKLKDLEQQQRLHLQYHLRLQEHQQKLTKQIEQSYLNMNTDSSVPMTCAVSNEQMSCKQEPISTDAFQQDCQVSVTDHSASSDHITCTQPLLSKEPSMMLYSEEDLNPPKKTPRKRGRPPKTLNHSSKTAESDFSFNTTSMINSTKQYEPENFLHTNVTVSNFGMSAVETKPGNTMTIYPQNVLSSETGKHVSLTSIKSEADSEMTLEKKINFLTNQIGLELSKNMLAHSSGSTKMTQSLPIKCENESENIEDTMYQEMKLAINRSLVDVKPRRKKVSRLLKSDENFMYATFKIKPKGLTPRKSRRRRKDATSSTTVVAETLSNLRQKALRDCVASCSDMDNSKPPSMVAWKFHEQYPCANEDEESKDMRMICVKCGNCLVYDIDVIGSRQCESCLLEQSEQVDNHEITMNNECKMDIEDKEIKAECCVTCGDVFQKHFSDPSVRCEVCLNSAPVVINSSKLFSFHDSPIDITQVGPSTTKPSPTAVFLTASENSLKESKFSDKGLTKMNNNHLFCSLCRMEFTKICDYLTHIRDTHETKLDEKTQLLSSQNDTIRKQKMSKTKKSLAHKTLTCPVEECPHFFREQKDLDLHFLKKHSNLNTGSHADSFVPSEDFESFSTLDHCMSTSTSAIPTTNGIISHVKEMLSSPEKVVPPVNTSEKPLQCELCDYRCRQKNALSWHMRKHPEAASQYRKYSNLNAD